MDSTARRNIGPSRLGELEGFGKRINKLGVNFAVSDAKGEIVLVCEGGRFKSSAEQLTRWSRQVLDQDDRVAESGEAGTPVRQFDGANKGLAVALKSARLGNKPQEVVAAALIDLGDSGSSFACETESTTGDAEPVRPDGEHFAEMLRLLAEKFQAETKAERQIEEVSTELSQTYEELVLLHRLSTNMKVTEADSNFLQMACDSLTEIVYVEGIAILLEKTVNGAQQWVIAAGSGLIDMDEQTAVILQCRLAEEIGKGKEALLDSEVDSVFDYEWPRRVKNIIAVPLFGKGDAEPHFAGAAQNGNRMMGLMVAINRIGKQDFDSTDIKLFNSVAGGCAVFIENGRLFKDLKELFIGSLKALTSSIDAKDKYTHGHSERVAYISRWIAERLCETEPLEEEQIHRIYLAGLLHDIGKIGIDESVLRKTGKLTDEEFSCIRKHPLIGAGILREIKQMRDVVPGALSHHERTDGKGYPDGLTGDQIPLAGKIVQLADSFDAMTSRRTYRDAMSVERAIEEIEKGLGTQFDERIGRVFLESDIYQLWDIIRDGFSEVDDSRDPEEYGAAAVGTLIR
ncbi:MAG: HD domain-containing phosphohydrolase [Planctomycetota bacterium]|jgi:HD-GYP domain-containing protein (c-di-GMP phosphodiesterase class II)